MKDILVLCIAAAAFVLVLIGITESPSVTEAIKGHYCPGYDVCEVKSRDSGRPYPNECQL